MQQKTNLGPGKALVAALLVLPLAVALAASGLNAAPVEKPIYVKAGAAWLSNSDSRDYTDSIGWSFGAGYIIDDTYRIGQKPVESSVEFNYSKNSGNGNKIQVMDISLVGRMGLGNGSANEPYVGLGVGVFRNTVDVSLAPVILPSALAPGASVDETATKIGFRLLLGMNFAENAFVEASYRLSGSTADVQTGAYGLSLGYRF